MKIELDLHGRQPKIAEGQIWWAGVGKNIGAEVYGRAEVALLHQARAMNVKRLYRKIGQIDDIDYARIREGFHLLYCK